MAQEMSRLTALKRDEDAVFKLRQRRERMAHLRRQEDLQCQIDAMCKKIDKMKEERQPILPVANRWVADADEDSSSPEMGPDSDDEPILCVECLDYPAIAGKDQCVRCAGPSSPEPEPPAPPSPAASVNTHYKGGGRKRLVPEGVCPRCSKLIPNANHDRTASDCSLYGLAIKKGRPSKS